MIAVRLPAAIEKRLDRLAKRTGRTKSFYVREALLNHLEQTIPLEEMMREHGSLEG
ncbi:MAG: ribbon-helix-helix domain-containing protein [Terracidiphilus sp.]